MTDPNREKLLLPEPRLIYYIGPILSELRTDKRNT